MNGDLEDVQRFGCAQRSIDLNVFEEIFFCTLLRKYAPTWFVQLSGVVDEEELQALRLQVQGATQQRLLREMAEAIEVGTARRPLVLIIEDLQWSDHSTLEFLVYLARRGQRARLLVVATYRPTDVVLRAHPLKDIKQELQAHGQCEELRLELLTVANVTEYVEGRFTETLDTQALGQLIHRRTEGNALFMVNVVEDLLRQGIIAEQDGRWELRGEGAQLDVEEITQMHQGLATWRATGAEANRPYYLALLAEAMGK